MTAPKKRGPGQPTKLNDALQKQIVGYVELGAYAEDAAQAVGIGITTFKVWMQKGEKQRRGRYAAFRTAVLEARAKARVVAAGNVTTAGRRSYQASLEFLERTDPSKWARREHVRVQLDAERDAMLEKIRAALPPDLYEKALAAVAELDAEEEESRR